MTNGQTIRRVGVVGTGIMGSPIARNLAAAGFEVSAWNRTASRSAPLEAHGVRVAKRAADLGECDAVITMLSDAPAIESAVIASSLFEALRPESLWLQMSTIGPEATLRLLDHCAAQDGPRFLDAPVLGTKEPAEQAKLKVLISGDPAAAERVKDVLSAISVQQLWLGHADEASRLKLVVNAWLVAMVGTLAETLTLAEDFDLDPASFLEAIKGSAIDTAYAQLKGPAILAGQFPPSFPLRLANKDVQLLLAEEAVSDTRKAFVETAAAALDEAVAQSFGEADVAAVGQVYRQR